MVLIDINDRTNPDILGRIDTYQSYGVSRLIGNNLYTIQDMAGVAMCDITNPYLPVQSEFIPIWREFMNDIAIDGNLMTVAFHSGDVRLFEIQGGDDNVEVGRFSVDSVATTVEIANEFCFVGTLAGKIHLFDLQEIEHPDDIWSYDNNNQGIQDLSVDGGLLTVSAGSNGLLFFDLTNNPEQPDPIGRLSIPQRRSADEFVISGNFLYVSITPDRLYCVDISNPTNPVVIDSISTRFGANPHSLAISGDYLYTMEGNRASELIVKQYDISDGNQIVEAGHFLVDDYGSLSANNEGVYYTSSNGLFILKNDLLRAAENPPSIVSRPILLECHPNPFNSSATLAYIVHSPSEVYFAMYNPIGQLVFRRPLGRQSIGVQHVTLSGEGLPNGTYFVNLQVGQFAEVWPIILHK